MYVVEERQLTDYHLLASFYFNLKQLRGSFDYKSHYMLPGKGLKKEVTVPCPLSHLCPVQWASSAFREGLSASCPEWWGGWLPLTPALFPPAPAAGGAGRGTCQAGHHDGAERHHRGTWTPQSASHRVYSPFIPLIYHKQRSTLILAGLKEWRHQGSGSPTNTSPQIKGVPDVFQIYL